MSARVLATNAFWSLLSHLFSRGSLMLSAVILARNLDTESFAAYSYFQLTVSMLAAYAAMGLGVSASRFFAEIGYEKSDTDPPPVGTLWTLSVLLAGGAFVLIMLIPSAWINAGLVVPKWLLAIGVLALGMTVVPGGAILGLERYKQATLISAVSGATMLLLVWWASARGSPTLAMGAIALSAFLQAAGESVIVIRAIGWKTIALGFRLRPQDVRRVLSLAGPMFFVTLVAASGSWLLGRMILHGAGGKPAFALYVIGLQWFSLGLLLPGMFSRVILPRLVRNASADVPAISGKQVVIQGSMMATATAAMMALLGALFGPWLLLIYGANYQADRWFVAAFLGAAVLSAPANTVGNAIVANEGQKTWLLLTVLWFLVLLVSGAVAAPLGALSGAVAQATAAAALTLTAVMAARAKRLI
jgi:O-antigen/teichoic acid export membrane protein